IGIVSIGLILFARTIAGLAAANFSVAQAVIADVTDPKDRAKNFGLVGAAFGIGFILGPVLGGWIASVAANAAAPFFFSGILGVLNLLLVTYLLPETRAVSKEKMYKFSILKGIRNLKSAFTDVDARPVYLTNFLFM